MTDVPVSRTWSPVPPQPTEPWDAYEGPPHVFVDMAISAARESPCDKSRRGAVIYATGPGVPGALGWPANTQAVGVGCNGTPVGAAGCTRDYACHQVCATICVHAEARALHAATQHTYPSGTTLHLIHVQVAGSGFGGGYLRPSGSPSCVGCSKQILDTGFISGVWLYELTNGPEICRWRYYDALTFHERSLEGRQKKVRELAERLVVGIR